MPNTKKLIRVMVTGHRNLGATNKLSDQTKAYLTTVLNILKEKYENIEAISGMAIGVDTIFANTARELDIPFIAAVPFRQQSGWHMHQYPNDKVHYKRITPKAWPAYYRNYYFYLLNKAKRVVYVDTIKDYTIKNSQVGTFHGAKYNMRNKWMVDYTSQDDNGLCIAIWSGRPGGTANCIRQANKANLPVIKYWPDNNKQDTIYAEVLRILEQNFLTRHDSQEIDVPF